MESVMAVESNAFRRYTQRQLMFPPFLTMVVGGLAVWAWCSFVFGPIGSRNSVVLEEATVAVIRAAVPFWAVFTMCFFIVSRQPRWTLKSVGWTGLAFSVFSLAVTVAVLTGR